jgi:hypothetical protein
MKITVSFDCTPEEARRLMGLPDLSSVHGAYLEKMRKGVNESVSPDYFVDVMKNWGATSEGALTAWQAMFEQMGAKKK